MADRDVCRPARFARLDRRRACHGSPGSESAIITFEIDGWDPARTVRELAERDVRVVSVPATHGQWDLGDRGVTSVVRASPHVYNDSTDVEALLDGVASVAGSARIDT